MVLLPRLPVLAANQLLQSFLADTAWAFDPLRLPDAVRFASTGGTPATSTQLVSLRDGLVGQARAFGFEQDGKDDFAKFDSALAAGLADVDYLHDSQALREDFWAFIGIVVAPDIVRWRFGVTPSRYLGGVRNTFQRLWLRGRALDRGHDSANRWGLVEALTEDALVQIVERPSLGAFPRLARAIAEAWVRASTRHGRERMEPIMRRATVRIGIQNGIRLLTGLTEADLVVLLDQAFDSASGIGASNALDRDNNRDGGTYRRDLPKVSDVLRTNGVPIPDRPEFLTLNGQGKLLAVWATLIGEGPVPTQARATMSLCAKRLRSQKWAEYERLRTDSDLYRAISARLTTATRAGDNGFFEIPRNSFVRAFKRTSNMTPSDWQDCTMRAIAEHEQGTAAREDIVRSAFQAAQCRYGIEAVKLRKPIRKNIERAIATCARQGLVEQPRRDTLTLRASYSEPAEPA